VALSHIDVVGELDTGRKSAFKQQNSAGSTESDVVGERAGEPF
jgi:hypothetical protein